MADKEKLSELLNPWLAHLSLCAANDLIAKGVTIPVRCKDCKYFVQGEPYDPCECMKWKVKWGAVYTTPDGYCHKGERKDNGK